MGISVLELVGSPIVPTRRYPDVTGRVPYAGPYADKSIFASDSAVRCWSCNLKSTLGDIIFGPRKQCLLATRREDLSCFSWKVVRMPFHHYYRNSQRVNGMVLFCLGAIPANGVVPSLASLLIQAVWFNLGYTDTAVVSDD